MKRFLLSLLAGLFLFTACSSTVEEISGGESSTDEEQGGLYNTLVSVGKPYTMNATPCEPYVDAYGQQLTDGQKTANIGAHYVDSRMVGFNSNAIIQIDLGEEDGKRITSVVARSLEMHQDGVTLAATVRVSGSADGKKFKTIGTSVFKESLDLSICEAKIELSEPTDYRYIRVQFFKGSGYFYFTDEIEVYADVPEKEITDKVALAYADESIDRNAWQSLSTGIEATPVDSKNLTVGKKYAFSDTEFDERAPKSDTLLTDGLRTAQYFSDPVWVGLRSNGEASPKIDLDLEKKYNNIYGFKVYAQGGGIGVDLPAYIDVYAQKGSDYIFAGRMYGVNKADAFTYTLLLPEYIEAQKIRFEFPKEVGSYWVEELQVLAGYNEAQSKVLFDPVTFPKITEDLFWDPSEPDYRKEQNLLLGLPQQVSALFYADVDTHGDESRADNKCLTDGKLATTSDEMYCYSSSWFFTRGGDGLEFFYDLGRVSTVNGVNLSLLEQVEWGISRPKFIAVYLSDDANNWYKVSDWVRPADVEMYNAATTVKIPLTFDKAYAARFVRFRVEGGFTFIDELEAFGTKEVKSSATRLADSGISAVPYYTNADDMQFATVENTPLNSDEIVLLYADRNKKEDLLPMFAYLDEDGNIKDTFMNGAIYCSHHNLPSGALGHLPNYKQDWEYSHNADFNGEAGFDALNETVGQIKQELGLTDYKVKVYSTFLTLHDTVSDFGDVDGDGISEDATTVEGRRKIFDWYINLTLDEFAKRNYEHIEYDGFYWLNEAVIWEHDDTHVITECGERVHAAGSNFLWVPYYKANRFFQGYEMNFDMICMQPNVVFSTDAPLWRFDSTVDFTLPRKMCVELEHSYQCLGDPSFARSYMLYLYYGAKTGYMDAIHVYYDDVANYALMANSDDPLCRMQYDATYAFAKGTLDAYPDKAEDVSVSGASDSVISADLNGEDAFRLYTLVTPPKHGYVTLNSDGSFSYFPEKGYVGSDSFSYTYNEYLGDSEPCTVNVTVE
ncbi:MAG: DUF4855 domain-containing protein [Clostridia bacterium]|nr:DUF4855 domain-containing protein [Clostridia bacterium]